MAASATETQAALAQSARVQTAMQQSNLELNNTFQDFMRGTMLAFQTSSQQMKLMGDTVKELESALVEEAEELWCAIKRRLCKGEIVSALHWHQTNKNNVCTRFNISLRLR